MVANQLCVSPGFASAIGRVHLSWENACASSYPVAVSDDGQNWREVHSTDQNQGDEEDIAFTRVEARCVRVFALKRGANFGASLYDFEVRAPKQSASVRCL